MTNASEITFDIKKHLGVLSTDHTGWTREANLVAWNGGEAKLDIRSWDPEHQRMTRGITLKFEEAKALSQLLSEEF